jgi:hypothetical protein
MKRLVIVGLVLLLAGNAWALRRESISDKGIEVGWYLVPEVKLADTDGDYSVFAGLRGGMVFNNVFYLGLAGYGSPHDDWDEYEFDCDCDCRDCGWNDGPGIGYGGFEFGIIGDANRVTHMSAGLLIGGGAVEEFRVYGPGPDIWYDSDEFFVMEPSFSLSVNITRKFGLGMGVSYRFIDDLRHPLVDGDDLDGPTFSINMKFGTF